MTAFTLRADLYNLTDFFGFVLVLQNIIYRFVFETGDWIVFLSHFLLSRDQRFVLAATFLFCFAFCKYLTQIGEDSFETTELCNCLRHVQLCAHAWKKPFFQPSFHRWCKMSCGSKWPLSGAMKLCSPQFKIMAEYIRLHRCQSLTRSGLYINGLSLSTLGLTASSSLSISVVLPRTAESE